MRSVASCHAAGVVHLDLKPENFVFTDQSCRYLTMVDFGSAEPFVRAPYAATRASPFSLSH